MWTGPRDSLIKYGAISFLKGVVKYEENTINRWSQFII